MGERETNYMKFKDSDHVTFPRVRAATVCNVLDIKV